MIQQMKIHPIIKKVFEFPLVVGGTPWQADEDRPQPIGSEKPASKGSGIDADFTHVKMELRIKAFEDRLKSINNIGK